MEPQPLIEFINLGWMLNRLMLPHQLSSFEKDVENRVNMFLTVLENIGYKEERDELATLVGAIKHASEEFTATEFEEDFNWRRAPNGTGVYIQKFSALMQRIFDRSVLEFSARQVILIDKGAVTEKLRELRETITGEQKEIILADTLRCLETGAYRAAIVMAWNLAYEHLRRWIYKSKRKRLKDFNAVLVTRRKDGANYSPLTDYDEFYELGERFVLDVAYAAKLFDKQKQQVLTGALNDRNHFAHPSSRRATAATATGFIENLIVNILDDPAFAYKE